jgi:hypothetical protein
MGLIGIAFRSSFPMMALLLRYESPSAEGQKESAVGSDGRKFSPRYEKQLCS